MNPKYSQHFTIFIVKNLRINVERKANAERIVQRQRNKNLKINVRRKALKAILKDILKLLTDPKLDLLIFFIKST